jgi:hypothetical protein
MDFAANTALPNCAGARGSPKAFILEIIKLVEQSHPPVRRMGGDGE